MANTINYIPTVFGAALNALRENSILPRLVRNISGSVGTPQEPGNVIKFPRGVAQAVAAVTPSNTPPANIDHAPVTVDLTVNTWQKTDFYLTDQELTQMAANRNYVPLQVGESMKALGNKIDQDGLALYKDIYGVAGTYGTTPFASDATAWTTGGRKLLNDQLAPIGGGDRHIVMDTAGEANAANLQQFRDASQRGSDETIRTGQVGFALGANWWVNQNMPTHTSGTLSDATGMLCLVNNASVAIGDLTLPCDETALTGTVVAGDVFTVAGDTQQYTITAGATAASNAITLTFTPGAKVAWADNAQVSFKDGATSNPNHVPNLAFHRDAFAFCAVPVAESMVPGVSRGQTFLMTDPITGIPFRLKITEEYYQTTWRFDVLYGWKTIRPEYAVRIAG